MGHFSEIEYEMRQSQDDQEALFQLSMERQQMAEEAAKRLRIALNGSGMKAELETLCREAGIESPYK